MTDKVRFKDLSYDDNCGIVFYEPTGITNSLYFSFTAKHLGHLEAAMAQFLYENNYFVISHSIYWAGDLQKWCSSLIVEKR